MNDIKNKILELRSRMKNHSSSRAFTSQDEIAKWIDEISNIWDSIQAPIIQEKIEPGFDEKWELEEFSFMNGKYFEENGIQFCSCCKQKVSKTRRRIEYSMISALFKAFDYCIQTRTRVFQKSKVNMNNVEYTLISYLVKFGLLYKTDSMKPGEFWIPMKRVAQFFKWEWSVAEYYEQNPLFKEWDDEFRTMSEKRIFVSQVPKHSELEKEFSSILEYINNNDVE